MRELIVMVIIAMFIGMAGAEDFVKATDVIAKDVGELSADQIKMIFEEDTWFMSGGPSMYTPSQNAFLKGGDEEGAGLGGVPLKLGMEVDRPNYFANMTFITPGEMKAIFG
jgi:hypothetical protein